MRASIEIRCWERRRSATRDGKLFIEVERNPGLRGKLTHRQFDTFRRRVGRSVLPHQPDPVPAR